MQTELGNGIRIAERNSKVTLLLRQLRQGRAKVMLHVMPDVQEVGHPNQGCEVGIGTGKGLIEEGIPRSHFVSVLIIGCHQITPDLDDFIGQKIEGDEGKAVENASDFTEVSGKTRVKLAVEEIIISEGDMTERKTIPANLQIERKVNQGIVLQALTVNSLGGTERESTTGVVCDTPTKTQCHLGGGSSVKAQPSQRGVK